jgi:hypothetical protein
MPSGSGSASSGSRARRSRWKSPWQLVPLRPSNLRASSSEVAVTSASSEATVYVRPPGPVTGAVQRRGLRQPSLAHQREQRVRDRRGGLLRAADPLLQHRLPLQQRPRVRAAVLPVDAALPGLAGLAVAELVARPGGPQVEGRLLAEAGVRGEVELRGVHGLQGLARGDVVLAHLRDPALDRAERDLRQAQQRPGDPLEAPEQPVLAPLVEGLRLVLVEREQAAEQHRRLAQLVAELVGGQQLQHRGRQRLVELEPLGRLDELLGARGTGRAVRLLAQQAERVVDLLLGRLAEALAHRSSSVAAGLVADVPD